MSDRELRAPKKKYFKMEYATVQSALEELTDIELGEYFKAVAEYELYGIKPESFSERVVNSLFNRTAHELDFQLDKHYANQEQGAKNYEKGREKKKEECTRLINVLTPDDLKALEDKYQCSDMLIEEVQKQIEINGTVIQYPRRYIEKYADDSKWNERLEAEIASISGVGI